MAPRPGSRDVARYAGVSQATVSAVINKSRFVTEETRERVVQAIAELGYRPNAIARSLKTQSSQVIGVIIPSLASHWWASLVRTIDEAANAQGYRIFLAQTVDDPTREVRCVEEMVDHRVAGLILVPSVDADPAATVETVQSVPTVMLNRSSPYVDADSVVFADLAGARAATEHLIGHGRRRIGAIVQPQRNTPVRNRLLGYQEALRAAGLPSTLHVEARTPTREDAERLTHELIAREPGLDALYVHSHSMTIGALAALEALARRIPEDVALIGYDEMPWNDQLRVPLSVVHQDYRRSGSDAFGLLMRRLAEPDRPPEQIVLPQQHVYRRSCGCP